jgi:hypothetical protein
MSAFIARRRKLTEKMAVHVLSRERIDTVVLITFVFC